MSSSPLGRRPSTSTHLEGVEPALDDLSAVTRVIFRLPDARFIARLVQHLKDHAQPKPPCVVASPQTVRGLLGSSGRRVWRLARGYSTDPE